MAGFGRRCAAAEAGDRLAPTDSDALALSQGRATSFAAGTTLYFGSAVVPRKRGGMGWPFTALLGFHKLYSRVLLGSAVRRLESR